MSNKGRSYTLRLVSIVTALSLVMMLFSSCRTGKTDIPDIPSPEDPAFTETEDTSPSGNDDPDEPALSFLNVALPYQDSTVKYLALMYYAKKNSLWDTSCILQCPSIRILH